MNAWLPQASYPCGNFSDTSSLKFKRPRGSIGHAFTVCIHTENQNQVSFYPFVLQEISVLFELTLGHLCYRLTDVPPQPNSLPKTVLDEPRGPKAALNARNADRVRAAADQVSKTTLKVVVSHCCLRSHLCCTNQVISQCQTRVKLNRVFFPRRYSQARSLGCGFARQ